VVPEKVFSKTKLSCLSSHKEYLLIIFNTELVHKLQNNAINTIVMTNHFDQNVSFHIEPKNNITQNATKRAQNTKISIIKVWET